MHGPRRRSTQPFPSPELSSAAKSSPGIGRFAGDVAAFADQRDRRVVQEAAIQAVPVFEIGIRGGVAETCVTEHRGVRCRRAVDATVTGSIVPAKPSANCVRRARFPVNIAGSRAARARLLAPACECARVYGSHRDTRLRRSACHRGMPARVQEARLACEQTGRRRCCPDRAAARRALRHRSRPGAFARGPAGCARSPLAD